MQESDTYLAIIDEGREKEAKTAILLFAEERLGKPDEEVKEALTLISDLDRLERMIRCAAKASSWQAILDAQ